MKQEFSIKGMSCNHCVAKVEETLISLNGVKKANVNLKKEKGKIKFDESKIQIEEICRAINELGYHAEVI